MGVAAILLAAGRSRRFGSPKQLAEHCGRPLLQHVAMTACASCCTEVVVVLGANAAPIRPVLASLTVTILSNDGWEEGIASSIRTGVSHVGTSDARGAILVACDQPALTSAHLDRLVAAHLGGAAMVASRYAGTLGIPALFDRAAFPALHELRGDRGAKSLLQHEPSVVVVDWPDGAFDLDVEEDRHSTKGDLRREAYRLHIANGRRNQ